jgi:hypothetical protein
MPTKKLDSHQTRLGIRDVEVRSEAEHLRRQLTEVGRQEHKLLDLYLDDRLATPALRSRLEEVGRRKAGSQERVTVAERRVASQDAETARKDAVKRFCKVNPQRGLDTNSRLRAASAF